LLLFSGSYKRNITD